MKKHHNIIIAGAGGIAEAVGLILMEWSDVTPTLFIGDRNHSKANQVVHWIQKGTSKSGNIHDFHLHEKDLTDEMKSILMQGDIILDCLPGSQSPRIAQFAKDFNLHYANLTEYVAETEAIKSLAKNANTGFLLQTGLAPGYIDLLANGLFQQFCNDYEVEKVDKLEFKVGALTTNAVAPHYYGFTWSPIGVTTEYLKDTVVLRDFSKIKLPSLSERATIIIEGIAYEEALTSGGAADLPDALQGKVQSLDYKTLRHPGHYTWIDELLSNLENKEDAINELQQQMQQIVPAIEDDQIVLYAAVEGRDSTGMLRRREISKRIHPQIVGKHTLRAIQITTAAPLAQATQLLLESSLTGIILQSQIDPIAFLNGNYIARVYGKTKL